jgi:hypothetical protein
MIGLTSMPDTLKDGRSLLEVNVTQARRKQLGQFFSGLQTGRLLAALSVRSGQTRFLDPMAGHGDLLESVAERACRLRLMMTAHTLGEPLLMH